LRGDTVRTLKTVKPRGLFRFNLHPQLRFSGYNGHANLSFNGPALHIAYYDLNQTLVLTEDWHVDIESGSLEGPSLKKVLDDPSLHCREA
jgi:hypothetical protein